MGVNGFNQSEYGQLLLDVGSGVSRARPSILIPTPKRSREIETPDRSIDTEDDGVSSANVSQGPDKIS